MACCRDANTVSSAHFLQDLKIRTFLPVSDLITLASKAAPQTRKDILAYFTQNHRTTYANLYDPTGITVPFLPITDPNQLATPNNCYADPAASIMGFQILHEDWRGDREKFGVRDHPSGTALLDKLFKDRPDVAKAGEIFGYLATRISDFTDGQWKLLRTTKFVPIPKMKNGKAVTVWEEPNTLYLGSAHNSTYGDYFTYVDFGSRANNFLRSCGAKEEPTPHEIARSLVASPRHFLDTMGQEKFVELLRTVASHFGHLRSDKRLVSQMKAAPWLIGVVASDGEDASEEAGKQTHYHYKLARAMDIYLVDDPVVNQLFKPLGYVPEEHLRKIS